LELFTVEAVETPSEYSVIVNPVSQSWQVGTGRLYDDLTTAGVNWRYRNELNEAWEVSQSVVSGSTLNHVIDVGGTWHSQITSQSLGYATASIPITSVNEGDTFYITGSEETFSLVATHSIFTTEVGYASSSVTIPMISVFDRYCISGTDQCCVTFVGDMTLPNDCAGENYTKWIGSMLYPTESVITKQFTTESLQSGDSFEISDGRLTYTLVASSNSSIPDSCAVNFFYVNQNIQHDIISMSMEINSLDNFYLTSSVSSSASDYFLVLESVDLGNSGNVSYIWDTSNATASSSVNLCGQTEVTMINNYQFLTGGSGVGKLERFDILISELSAITSSCGVTFDVDGYTINFTSSVSGSAGNSYTFSINETTSSFGGGSTSSSVGIPDDSDTVLYFLTGSTLDDSVSNLSSKISSLNILESEASTSTLSLTAATLGIVGESITFQSGSSQFPLGGSTTNTNVSSSVSQSYRFESSDVKLDVTDIVNSWVSGEIPNNGFIIRNSDEGDNKDYGKLRFFSHNTNTIYIPRLTMKWDDQVFSTGSLEAVDLDIENVAYVRNLKEEYKSDEIVKLDILARDRYPQKSFTNRGSRYTTTKYLPINSVFAVQDASSKEYIIPFDDKYTKISCDSDGPYFMLDMSSLPQERYYRLMFKSSENGITSIFKEKAIFKVIR